MADEKLSALPAATDTTGAVFYGVQGGAGKKFPASIMGGGDVVACADRTALKALDTATTTEALLTEAGREGLFLWDASDLSATLLGSAVASSAVDSGTETITSVAHDLRTGQAVVTTTAVDGLSLNTLYYVIRVDADNFKLASSFANAEAGAAFNLTGTTAITVKLHKDPKEGVYVCPSADISGATGAWVRAGEGSINLAKWFGLAAANTASQNAEALTGALALTTGTLLLPVGSFVTNAVSLKAGTLVRGSGKHATRLLPGANSINVLQFTASGAISWDFGIKDLGFDVNSKTGCTAISIDGNTSAIRVSHITISDLEIQGTFDQGIDLRFTANSVLTDVFCSQVVDAFVFDNAADTDVVSCKAQSGTGKGFKAIGGAGAFDEGLRLVGCTTNGQAYGLYIDGQEWGDASSCSFTTCTSGALVVVNTASNWKFAACEFAVAGGAPANTNAQLPSTSSNFSFSGCQFVLGTFGAVIRGTRHTVTGCTFLANSNVDLYLDGATECVVTGNQFDSTTAAWSCLEAGAADLNTIVGNFAAGLTVVSGASSAILRHADGRTYHRNSGGDGVVPGVSFVALLSNFTGSDVNTAQPVFLAAQDTLTLLADRTYEFEAEYFITRAAGTTSHTTGVLFGGTATFDSIKYLAQVINPTGNVLAAVQMIRADAATEVVLTAANTSATENLLITLKGRIRTNAAGTIIPQFKYSAAPGGAPTVLANSCFKIWELGTDQVVSIGPWA